MLDVELAMESQTALSIRPGDGREEGADRGVVPDLPGKRLRCPPFWRAQGELHLVAVGVAEEDGEIRFAASVRERLRGRTQPGDRV